MAFLDNSGDIILDAVLTDTGRMRLAKGDGSFRISKFALGDDEIDYALYDLNQPSNSQDLNILQTPILEAFTNNTSNMNSRLTTYTKKHLLYLPIIKLNEIQKATSRNTAAGEAKGSFIVAVNLDTVNAITPAIVGEMFGADPLAANQGNIQCDQGLDTSAIPPTTLLGGDLSETQYTIEIDNRLGSIYPTTIADNDLRRRGASPSFIDDDQIASYYFTLGTDPFYVSDNTDTKVVGQSSQTIQGPRGTTLQFRIGAALGVQNQNYLFTKLGTTGQTFGAIPAGTNTFSFIDTQVRVTGLTTGYRLDVPVRFIRKE